MKTMSPRRRLVLEFIKAYVKKYGVPPILEVIANGLGLKSRSGIHRIVHHLEREGYLYTIPNKTCSIRLLPKAKEIHAAPDKR